MKGYTFRLLLLGLIFGLLSSCKNNPYPDGQYTAQKPAVRVIAPVYGFSDIPTGKVTFSEGVSGSFIVKGMVPAPGNPIITFENLPAGATYSDVDNKFSWTPDYDAGNDPQDPRSPHRIYEIVAILQSDKDPKTVARQTILLQVNDLPRNFKIDGLNFSTYYREGDVGNFEATIIDEDSPNGPFIVSATDAPPGVTVTQSPSGSGHLKVKINFGFDLIDSNYTSTNGTYKSFNWNLSVVNPKGRVLSVPLSFQVSDNRMPPVYLGADAFESSGKEFNFVFSVTDPNLEVVPQVTLRAGMTGNIDYAPIGNVSAPFSQAYQAKMVVTDNEAGTEQTVPFTICAYDSSRQMNNCTDVAVKIKFTFSPPPPPPTPVPTPQPTPDPNATPQPSPTAPTQGGNP